MPSLYFTHKREVFNRDGHWLAALPCIKRKPTEEVVKKLVRCRTIGDITCTGLTESKATTVADIIADTPGHIQYTRNMVTGASTADLSIILIDARHGVLEQTVRHSYISSLLGITHILVAINKMDLVDFSKDVYDKIVSDYKKMSEALDIKNVVFIPISAKDGDNGRID